MVQPMCESGALLGEPQTGLNRSRERGIYDFNFCHPRHRVRPGEIRRREQHKQKIALRLSFCLGLVFEGTCANMGTCLVHRRGWRDFHKRRGTFTPGLRLYENFRGIVPAVGSRIKANTERATPAGATRRNTSPRSSKTRLW